jgi:hypothetical protein
MFEGKVFRAEMKKMADNVTKYYTVSEAWELYEHINIAVQNAWYQELIDKETMQKTISMFVDAAMGLELKEKEEQNLYGYLHRPF